MERRETMIDSGNATPRRLSLSGKEKDAELDFPVLEKRTTHLADEDEFAIM